MSKKKEEVKIKGKKKLNNAISAQLAPFGITRARLSDEYAYFFKKECVTFKLTEDFADALFNKFIERRFGYKVEHPFIISLLHEVGHHLANDEIEGAISEFCDAEKDRIAEAMEEAITENEVRALEYQYFNLPDEIMATQWAVNYAKENPQKVEEMWEKCAVAFAEFYERNGVTE